MSGHDKVTFLKKSVWIKNVFTGFDSDKHTLIGDKNIGITKIGETKLKTLRRAEIHFWCPDMIFSTFSKNQIFQDVQSISDEKEALKYVSTMSQASLGLNPCFLYPTFEPFDVLTWCPDMILTWYQKMFWAHWLILHIKLLRITTLLHWSTIYSSRSLSISASTLLCLVDFLILTLS